MRVLRFLFSVCPLVLAAAGLVAPAAAQDRPGEADRTAIVAVIRAQLDALQGDRADEAFAYASPGIQAMFGTAETFISMVKTGYPAVYRPQSVTFRDLVAEPRGPVQRVLLVGPDGVPVVADYIMERQPDGTWRIDGCLLEKGDAQTA
jgi:hypothetical protein